MKRPSTSVVHESQSGFTIVEMMIATAVFSVILVLCAMGIVNVGRQFFKGVTINRTQNTARTVAEDVGQAIQFGGPSSAYRFSSVGGIETRCYGTVRYTFVTNRSLGPTSATQLRHVLWKDRVSASNTCTTPLDLTLPEPSSSANNGGQELLGADMRLPVFEIIQPNLATPTNKTWGIQVVVSYGDDPELFEPAVPGFPAFTRCIGQKLGGQFCASSRINTSVVKRL